MGGYASYLFENCKLRDEIKRLCGQMKKWVTVNDRMQKGYRYELTDPVGATRKGGHGGSNGMICRGERNPKKHHSN